MKKEKKIKVLLPNILTASRLVLTPIIIFCGITNNMKIVLILVVIAALTDMFDGKLARKFHTVSDFGAKLDAVCDKVFAIGITLSLINKFSFIKILLAFEIIIACINLFIYYKKKVAKSLMIGKIKTVFLFTLIVMCFFNIFFSKINILDNLIYGLTCTTINLQILSIVKYIINYFNINIDQDDDNDNNIITENEEEIEKTIMIDNLKDLSYDYEDDNIY